MRTFAIYGATLGVVGLLAAGMGACSDGGGDLPVGKAGSSSTTGSTAAIGGSDAAGTGSVVPSGGMVSAAGSTGVGNNDTGGMPVVTAGSSNGGASTAGTSSGGMPATAGTGTGGMPATGLKTGPFKMLMMHVALEFPHTSIGTCTTMLKALGMANAPERATITGLAADTTWTVDDVAGNSLAEVTAENLAAHEMFYSNNPTGKVFTEAANGAMKKQIFQTWMDNGGAWAGQHSASDFEKNGSWPWFQDKVVGGWFVDHNPDPNTSGTIAWEPDYAQHPILKGLASPWNIKEEWYVMNRDIAAVPGFKVLAKVTTTGFGSYPNATVRPAIWITENAKGGRAFYTIQGHSESTYAEPQFRQLMLRGILWSVHRLPGGN